VTFCPDAAVARAPGGGFIIDELHCKGCGLCVAECPRGAMTLAPEETR
jgi:pyruvate ferredoxin oxidoreductase delta subunit